MMRRPKRVPGTPGEAKTWGSQAPGIPPDRLSMRPAAQIKANRVFEPWSDGQLPKPGPVGSYESGSRAAGKKYPTLRSLRM